MDSTPDGCNSRKPSELKFEKKMKTGYERHGLR